MNKRVHQMELDGVVDFSRQRDFFDPTSISAKLTVIGTGGIGSMFSVMAGKLGIGEITVYDDDLVETHNLPNQFFALEKQGHHKVDAIKEAVEQFTIAEVTPIAERVTADTKLNGMIVSGVDSMEARTQIAASVHASRFTVSRYWDARIGGEKIVIYSVNPKDPAEWKTYMSTLYSDEEAQDDPCTRRSVIDVMGHVDSHLLTGVREHLAGNEPDGFTYYHVGERKLYAGKLVEMVYVEA